MLTAFAQLARPHQATKNLFVFLPAFFAGEISDTQVFGHILLTFLAFCMLAGASYALNDVRDRNEDRNHPGKRLRPIAAGLLSPLQGILFGIGLAAAGMIMSLLLLSTNVVITLAAYLVLNVAYSMGLKHKAIVDVSCVAFGFVLRVLAGSFAAGVPVSNWLLLMTYLLAMFLALGKRWDDLRVEDSANGETVRKSLDGYSSNFVSNGMVVMASVNLVAYIMYTTTDDVVARYGTDSVFMTSIWVITGILRYLQVTFVKQKAGAPTKVLMEDRFIQLVIIGWLSHLFYLLYL